MKPTQIKSVQIAPLIAMILFQQQAFSEPLKFADVLEKALNQSPELAAQKHETRAHELALDRTRIYWLPELGLRAEAYSTNDPAANFFGVLSERSVSTQDFSPSTLNSPGYNNFENVTLGLDLPLYEGGRKSETANAMNSEFEASNLTLKLKKREVISQILGHYGNLVSDQSAISKLAILKEQVQKILSKYTIGSTSNPVGYSGILGLKGLNNRIDTESIGIETSKKSHQIALAEKTNLSKDQIVASEKQVKEIAIASSGKLDAPLALEAQSLAEELSKKKEDTLLSMKNAERARFLPKIGLFGNEALVHGGRDTGYATTGGVYLQWSLFSPDNYNRVSEQNEHKEAANQEKEQAIQDTRILRASLNDNEIALEKTLTILAESDHILDEQVKAASHLYQSGSISALQLAEVYNRRADLILNLRQVEQNWINLKGKKIILMQAQEDNL